MKEKADKHIMIMLTPTLLNAFKGACGNEGRCVSEVLRELMSKFIKENNGKSLD